jgi:hypothetical protein
VALQPRKGRASELPLASFGTHAHPEGYEPVPAEPAPVAEEEEEEDSDSETELRVGRPLRGWAVFWMWFPAFFDSESRVVGGVPGSLAHTPR